MCVHVGTPCEIDLSEIEGARAQTNAGLDLELRIPGHTQQPIVLEALILIRQFQKNTSSNQEVSSFWRGIVCGEENGFREVNQSKTRTMGD